MSILNWLTSRFNRTDGRRHRDEDIRREVKSHLDLETEEQLEAGLAPGEARNTARRLFGNDAMLMEDVRAIWTPGWMERFCSDLRYAARSLRKSPGFTIVAVATLTLGIGANTAIFSAIDAVMLRPLPFSNPDQIVRIYSTKGGALITGFAYPGGPSGPDLRDFADNSHSFEKMIVYDQWRKNVSFADAAIAPEQMHVGLVPAAYFEILGMRPIMGRFFTDDENQKGRSYVAAISARLWRERFARDRAVLGRKIIINGESYEIIAVMPDVIPDWMEPGVIEVWTPLAFSDVYDESGRGSRGWGSLARIKPGLSLKQAQTELAGIAAQLAAKYPVDDGVGVQVTKLADTRAGSMRPMLLLLMGAVSLILLIACVNLANLLLARSSGRQQELAVRAALGAGRARLIQQLFAETLLLSFAGAAAGLFLARAGVSALAKMQAGDLSELGAIQINWRVLAFTLAASLTASLLFGLAPALTGSRANLVDALKDGGRAASAGRGGRRMRNILVIAEVAMSLMLVVAAALLVQSIVRLQRQSLGINQDHLLRGHYFLPDVRYPNPGAIARFCDDFASRVRSLPGVVDATVTTLIPPKNGWTQMLGIPGRPVERAQDIPLAQFGVADSHYLKTMGIRLLSGRDFAESDRPDSPPVALVNEQFRRSYFQAEDPVGRKFHIGPPPFLNIPLGGNVSDSVDATIIGVVADFRNAGLGVQPEPQIVVLYSQNQLVNYGFKEIVVRTSSDPHLLAPEISRQLRAMDSDLPFSEVETMDERIDKRTSGQRFTTVLLGLFAAAGLALAAVGIYGVVSFMAAQRRQELAVRIAMGARKGNVLWLVVRQGLQMAAIGAVIGLFGAWGMHRFIGGLLFQTSPVDPVTFACGALFLLAVAALASAVPGMRIASIDPVQALRQG